MAHELSKRGLTVTRQQPIPLVHEDVRMGVGFRADLNKIDRSNWAGSQEATTNLP